VFAARRRERATERRRPQAQAEGGYRIGYTFLTNDVPPGTFGSARGFRVDLSTGDGLAEAIEVRRAAPRRAPR
jgi:hypothetical protein